MTPFKASMLWLHTWFGVALGALLFAIFWTGSLSVFYKEIDRWMMPMTRLQLPASVSLDAMRPAADALAHGANAPHWKVYLPTTKEPVHNVIYPSNTDSATLFPEAPGSIMARRFLDPNTGAPLEDPGTLAGDFLYSFHFKLALRRFPVGYYPVALAGMAMLALIVSGTLVHGRIIANFFLFRRQKKARASLDLHNAVGILGLPFHFLITLTGIIFFYNLHYPLPLSIPYGEEAGGYNREAIAAYARPEAGIPAEPASLDKMAAEAARIWGRPVGTVRVYHPGDQNAYALMMPRDDSAVSDIRDSLFFDVPSGELLYNQVAKPALATERFIVGLHLIHFRHWPVRWLYFLLGLSGCVLIATGFLYWLESRRKRHTALGLRGVRFVEGLTVGSTTGVIIATLAFLIANRLLPSTMPVRAAAEVGWFYFGWLAAYAHAWLRPGSAWYEQAKTIAVLAVAAVVLNATTTGDHLLRTIARGDWAVAGVDMMLLVSAGIAAVSAKVLSRRQVAKVPQVG